MTWTDDLKWMGERIAFSFGMILNLLLNIVLIPYYLVRKIIGKPVKELIIWPEAMKVRVEMYGKLVKEESKKNTDNP